MLVLKGRNPDKPDEPETVVIALTMRDVDKLVLGAQLVAPPEETELPHGIVLVFGRTAEDLRERFASRMRRGTFFQQAE